jgi:hypothetical protein
MALTIDAAMINCEREVVSFLAVTISFRLTAYACRACQSLELGVFTQVKAVEALGSNSGLG